MCNDVLKLIAQTNTTNQYGDVISTETVKEVFCQVKSVGMNEKYEALAIGLKPEYKFILEDYYEYDEQEHIEYKGLRYRVLRSYRDGQRLELVVTRDGCS